MTSEEKLKADFLDISEQASQFDYYPTRFLQMVHELGAVATAKRLLADTKIQTGLMTLCLAKRLDLSLEAQVLKPEYIDLFTPEETRAARLRLEKLDYKPGGRA